MPLMSVVVQLRGGLGNQLFQYAAGVGLSTRLETELLLDRSLLPPVSHTRNGISRWPEQISSFEHAGHFVGQPGGQDLRSRASRYRAQLERTIGDSRWSRTLGRRVYARETLEDAAAFERNALTTRRINAYCSAPVFFEPYGDTVAAQIQAVREPGEWFLAERERLRQAGAIALHVRWGDYLNLRAVYGEIPASYYRRAVEVIERTVGTGRPVWLFSDDAAGASAFLEGAVRLDHVVDPPEESTPLENLLLLGSASALVGANSTFSWWAAFLADAAPGSVVFPRPLFGPAGPPEPRDWLRPDWLQLGR